ncbi:transglutaminase family protein [Salipaludibacillus sp. LMS25]|jgi:transglutaminase-like putative cysteine protease|uniref:transglutaminase-like domain-containing protein n=1 Tax=Salipaludibacillus sp. LMS25 TaxID=2924031 RepID=UPI0020D17AE4|nr:transglutaminase family protein [Salipaludibacillus sp. LMS25]UTR13985.1 transglutaminase family protein [Salipaludibacillus sp. LMS25]
MELICDSSNLENYLIETAEVNYSHPLIKEMASSLFSQLHLDVDKAKAAFEFVRDKVSHSWDIQGTLVTSKASDVLSYRQGICYAKSMLLAALLRSQRIPTGFCYQRLMLFDTPKKGYSIHALNAVFFKSLNKWIRLDARGNKEGINAQFSINKEKLAFSVNEGCDEKDYPVIYSNPHPKTVIVLNMYTNAIEMYKRHLPTYV